jgi:hypothetical protein
LHTKCHFIVAVTRQRFQYYLCFGSRAVDLGGELVLAFLRESTILEGVYSTAVFDVEAFRLNGSLLGFLPLPRPGYSDSLAFDG